jgi:hypothetical protein
MFRTEAPRVGDSPAVVARGCQPTKTHPLRPDLHLTHPATLCLSRTYYIDRWRPSRDGVAWHRCRPLGPAIRAREHDTALQAQDRQGAHHPADHDGPTCQPNPPPRRRVRNSSPCACPCRPELFWIASLFWCSLVAHSLLNPGAATHPTSLPTRAPAYLPNYLPLPVRCSGHRQAEAGPAQQADQGWCPRIPHGRVLLPCVVRGLPLGRPPRHLLAPVRRHWLARCAHIRWFHCGRCPLG